MNSLFKICVASAASTTLTRANRMNSSLNTSPHIQRIAQPTVALRIIAGPHQGEERRLLSSTNLVVGRGKESHWRLQKDKFFSRNHFRLEAIPPACRLVDLGSANGTCVNGSRADDVLLKDGDNIECGDTVFAVTILAVPPPADTPTLPVPPERRIDPSLVPPPNFFPRRIAAFELTREISRGGMGVVYHAIQQPTGREAAIKTILPTVTISLESKQLFMREASIISRLRHPRIVECLEVGIHEDDLYLAMEYLPVIDFQQFLAVQTPEKRIRSACGVICRVLEALQHAHDLDIVHRDIKPSNILVYRSQRGLQVKLADFGLAKNYVNAGLTLISCENRGRGTLAYAAPEQLTDSRHAKPPCDIFSTGACLYEFLSAKRPFQSDDGDQKSVRPLDARPRPLAERATDLPQELIRTVDRALAHQPSDRFSSAENMRRALLKFAAK